jgi:FkbM family methyltransferase
MVLNKMICATKNRCCQIKRYISQICINVLRRKYIEITCAHEWFGSDYGGFPVCTEILDEKKEENIIVYSIGVGCDISFDLGLLNKYKNVVIYAFDPTPVSINWVKKQNLPENYLFFPIGINKNGGKERMYLPQSHGISFTAFDFDISNKEEIEVDMETIANIMDGNNHTFIDILKMDIEGSEFEVLKSINYCKYQFGQILVEFHERLLKDGKKKKKEIISILRENGYKCFAVSPEYEYGFINEKYYEGKC